MAELKLLAPGEIAAWEGQLRPFIDPVCARSRGRYAPEHFIGWGKSGEWQFWLALTDGHIDAICITEILTFATGIRGLAFRVCTGTGRSEWQHHITDILAWGKARGCVLHEGLYRPGWWRVLRWFLPAGSARTHELVEGPL